MTNNENILDKSLNDSPPKNKWKLAFLSISILVIAFSIVLFFQDYIPIVMPYYASMIFALYFFIKRINYEEMNMAELFSWGIFIILGGNLFVNNFYVLFFSDMIIGSISEFIFFNLGSFFRCIILGSTLSFGVFHLIKNKSWSMLFLMIFASWMFQTLLIFDPALFGG
ncbi:MAG: hypothetical protein AB8F94_04090 [Saprospiraceae bacterium]